MNKCGVIELNQHWFRWWFVFWKQQAINRTNVTYTSVRSCGIHLRVISQWILHISFLGVSLNITNFRLPPLSQGPMSSENGTQNVTQIPDGCFANICDRVLPLMHNTLISYWCFSLYITACFIVCFSCFYHIYLFKTWWNKGGRTINNITSIVITRIWGSITIILHFQIHTNCRRWQILYKEVQSNHTGEQNSRC